MPILLRSTPDDRQPGYLLRFASVEMRLGVLFLTCK